jgi:hypothetical protein
MGKLFDEIYESVVASTNRGGYVAGQLVKFKPGYKKTPAYQNMTSQLQKSVDELASSGLNIHIIEVGDNQSGASAGNQNKTANEIVLTIAGDQGGRRYYGSVTVSPDMVEVFEDDGFNLPKVPDQFKKVDKITIKPEPVQDFSGETNRQTDKGDGKNTPANYRLPESTILKMDNANMAMLLEDILTKN